MSIAEARRAHFTYEPAAREVYASGKPILSVILDAYYGLNLVQQSVQSVLDQDYSNVELILVDNAAQPDVAAYLRQVHETHPNAPLVRFNENQFAWDDINRAVAVCWNAALLNAKGDFVSHLSYDDMISPDYATRMVRLFVDNPNCVTAAPLPESIDASGRANEAFNRGMVAANRRGTYTPGRELAMDFIGGQQRRLFAAPGEIFAIRKTELLSHDGFDRLCDTTQILKYAVLGDSGFDPDARLYWRHHDAQLNRQGVNRGFVWYESMRVSWEKSGIIELWRSLFEEREVAALVTYRDKQLDATPLAMLRENVRSGKLSVAAIALANIVSECPHLLPRALRAAAVDLAMLLPRASYTATRRAAVKLLPARAVAAARARRGAKV